METKRCNEYPNETNYGSVKIGTTSKGVRDCDSIAVNLEKRPKRVLHFSNGVVEEYSDDDDEQKSKDCVDNYKSTVDLTANSGALVSMDSRLYGLNQAQLLLWSAGRNALQMCDYLGEKLAALFGITTPKYRYEIEEYKRIVKQEQAYIEKRREHFAGWTQTDNCEDALTQNVLRVSSDKQVSPEQQSNTQR